MSGVLFRTTGSRQRVLAENSTSPQGYDDFLRRQAALKPVFALLCPAGPLTTEFGSVD